MANIMVYLDWKYHQDEIIEQFCVNKESPELMCSGKCHLAKMMDLQSKDSDGPLPKRTAELNLQPWDMNPQSLKLIEPTAEHNFQINNFTTKQWLCRLLADEEEQPPEFLA